MTTLDASLAARFMALTLGHLGREYPYKMDLVYNGPEDARPPAEHHPIFHGSFDWHSCVHGWWQVMRLARLFPDLPEAQLVRERADAMLVPDKVAGELAYLARPNSAGFSRPYGWAWLLTLHAELARHDEIISRLKEDAEKLSEHLILDSKGYFPHIQEQIRLDILAHRALMKKLE